jgi:predicted acyltransferase
VVVPGYGLPGRDIPLLDPDRNIVAWIDRHIFSAQHLYEHTRDPEGLLSTIPAVGTALIGVLTGIWLRTGKPLAEKARGIALAGLTFAILGALWNPWFAINKKLWTSTFVLFAGGLSLLLLALSIWIVDIMGEKRGDDHEARQRRFWPLLVFGMNAIAAYVLSELLPGILSRIPLPAGSNPMRWYQNFLVSTFSSVPFASLIFSFTFALVCWVPMYVLYRKRIFFKV